MKLRKHAFAIIESDSHFKIFNSKILKSIIDQHLGVHIYSTHVRTVPPVPITHFSITTYAYVHVEATYKSGPPKTSNSLQHIHIYSTAGPNPDTEQQQPQIKKTTLKNVHTNGRNKLHPSVTVSKP